MSETVINGLIKRKEEITTEINNLQVQLKGKNADIAILNAAIRIFLPEHISPKKARIQRGGIARELLNTLRNAAAPMTSRTIAEEIVGSDSNELAETAKRVGATIYNYQKKGMIKSVGGVGNAKLWELV